MRIGINGLGRIGRAIFRIATLDDEIKVACVNDIDPLLENHSYLLNYDSNYGRFEKEVSVSSQSKSLRCSDENIAVHVCEDIAEVPWSDHGVDVVVDASGVASNVFSARSLLGETTKKVVVTHSPKDGVDHTVIIGANEHTYQKDVHQVISASICDANACAPILNSLIDRFGVEDGFITTLHPWLGYQNLVDGSLKSVTNPGHYWQDLALGRGSTESLIPKSTTLMPALDKVLPRISMQVHAMSFRVPTSIVAASDMTLRLSRNLEIHELIETFENLENKYPNVVTLNNESLVSIDFKGISQSLVIDLRWLRVYNDRSVKVIAWYDNEWGYSNRVLDVVKHVAR